MRSTALLLLDLLILFAKSLRPGGCKAIIAENLILRHQLTVLSRSRRKAPNLRARERIALGCLSLFISPRRLRSVAIVIKPATLLKFHRALVKRKYRRLFSNSGRKRRGAACTRQALLPRPRPCPRSILAHTPRAQQRQPLEHRPVSL